MITVSIKINRSSSVVWKYFTTITNWSKWYGGSVKTIVPSWQQGAKIIWEIGGADSIIKFIPEQEISLSGAWTDTTYKFEQEGNSITIVKVIESDPKGGASFNDGGTAHKADLEAMLQNFKKCVEQETNVNIEAFGTLGSFTKSQATSATVQQPIENKQSIQQTTQVSTTNNGYTRSTKIMLSVLAIFFIIVIACLSISIAMSN